MGCAAGPIAFPWLKNPSDSPEVGTPQDSEFYPLPNDLDCDGFYEDLNGNGEIDFTDVIIYFKYMDWIRENQPVNLFDYNNNGDIDFKDVITLFYKT